ncbi:hypothetical protein LTR01_004990 [Friedmanniomyces endolithicus]|nr:hypothetical protein LTR01_004990 [Friedmanniomyces endolithicus]
MQQSARAIVCHDTHANSGWKMEDVGVRKPGDGELLVEMVASGVCHTDVLIGGIPGGAAPIAFYPRVLGHEVICKDGHYSNCNDFNDLNFGGYDESR